MRVLTADRWRVVEGKNITSLIYIFLHVEEVIKMASTTLHFLLGRLAAHGAGAPPPLVGAGGSLTEL